MNVHPEPPEAAPRETLAGQSPWEPEDSHIFRLAQLVLLLSVTGQMGKRVTTVDRLGYYDFFAANPFVVLEPDSQRDQRDRLSLKLAGFEQRQLSYASTGERWASRRRRLQHDLALLISLGLVTLEGGAFDLTLSGQELSTQLSTVYADAYRTSAAVVLRRLTRMSDRALRENVERWLGSSWLDVDLLDDVTPESVRVGEETSA